MSRDGAENNADVPLSILQIGTQYNLGGIPRHMLTLTDSLRAAGDHVTLSGTAGKWAGPEGDESFLDLPIRFVASEGGAMPKRIGHLLTSVFRLWRWLGRNKVHTPSPPSSSFPPFVPFVPFVVQ